jgi:AcrR family transcriptional regulator
VARLARADTEKGTMTSERKVQQRGVDARQRILKAALETVGDGPLADVQISQIARRAQMNDTTVLYYYPSKFTIFIETLRWVEGQLADRRAVELPKLAGPDERLARFISLYLPDGPDDPVWKLWFEAWLRSGKHPEIRGILLELVTRWADDFKAIAREGIDAGHFELDDPDEYYGDLAAFLAGLAVQMLVGRVPRTPLLRRALERTARDMGADLDLMLPELRSQARRRAYRSTMTRTTSAAKV